MLMIHSSSTKHKYKHTNYYTYKYNYYIIYIQTICIQRNNVTSENYSVTDWVESLSQSSVPILDRQSATKFSRPGLYLNFTLNSCKAKDHLMSFELLGDDSVRNVNGLWSEYSVTSEPKIHCLNFCNDQIAANYIHTLHLKCKMQSTSVTVQRE
jgi:hypothetical protein